MKIIILFIIILLLLFSGVMSYFYIESFNKNKQLILALDEAGNLKSRLKEEILQRESLQEALQKENEELKKESLSYLSRQKEMDDKRQQIEKMAKQQSQKIKDIRKELQTAKKELGELKQENLGLADIKNFVGNVQVEKQEEKIRQLEADFSSTKDQMKKQETLLHYNLGVAYTKEKNYDMAIDEYEKASSLSPQDADTHYNLAIIYDEVRKNPKRAIQHYQKYLELKPEADDIDEVKDWIASLMLGEDKIKETELGKSTTVAVVRPRQEKIKGIFLKKAEEIPQRDKGQQ